MKQFTTKYTDKIKGTLSGFDRLVFRGTLPSFNFDKGRKYYLYLNQIRYKDFGAHAQSITERVKKASLAPIQAEGRPVQYLSSPKTSKEDLARQIAKNDNITDGTICVLRAVEPCYGFAISGNKDTERLELVTRFRKCLHYYHYWIHPVFGFMNARIQTWFPFTIQIC